MEKRMEKTTQAYFQSVVLRALVDRISSSSSGSSSSPFS
jgi:hypothetical protein